MTSAALLSMVNYALVLIYGVFLSADIAGGWETKRQKRYISLLCPLLLAIQCPFYVLFDADTVRRLYPLIVHLPLILALILLLKKPFGLALVSVCTANLCCQLPRWIKLSVTVLSSSALAGEASYTLLILPIFFLLRRYVVTTVHSAISDSRRSLLLFGSLPAAYYLFDYATAVYSDLLYGDIQALNEFLPTALIAFYMLFLMAYRAQTQKQTEARLQNSALSAALKQASIQIEVLRQAEMRSAVYQHDMRHHLNIIDSFLAAEKPQQAKKYIRSVQADVEAITPKRFCENEIVTCFVPPFPARRRAWACS